MDKKAKHNPPDVHSGPGAPAAAKRRRRKAKRILILLLALLAGLSLLTACLPYLLSTSAGTRAVLGAVRQFTDYQIQIRDLSLTWQGPIDAADIQVTDPQGRTIFQLRRLAAASGLWQYLFQNGTFQDLLASGLSVDIYPSEGEAGELPNLLRQSRGRIEIQEGQITWHPAAGGPLEVRQLNGRCDVQTLNHLQLQVQADLWEGRLDLQADIERLFAQGRPDPAEMTASIHLASQKGVQLASIAHWQQDDLAVAGSLHLEVQANLEPGKVQAQAQAAIGQFLLGAATAANAKPLDWQWQLDLTGQNGRYQLAGRGRGAPGSLDLNLDYQVRDAAASWPTAPQWLAAILQGESLALPPLELTASGQLDLPSLAGALPILRENGSEWTWQEGVLTVDSLSVKTASPAQSIGRIRLERLVARNQDRAFRTEPLTAEWDWQLAPRIGLQLRQTELKSDFARLQAQGTGSQMQGEFTADLRKLAQQLAVFAPALEADLDGSLQGRFALRRAGQTADQVEMTVDLEGQSLRYQGAGRSLQVEHLLGRYQGEIRRLTSEEDTRLVTQDALVNLDERFRAQYSGWYDLKQGVLEGRLTVEQADLGYLERQVRQSPLAESETPLWAGSLAGQIDLKRQSDGVLLLDSGAATIQDMQYQQKSLLEEPVQCRWDRARFDLAAGSFEVEQVTVDNPAAQLRARQLSGRRQEQIWHLAGQFDLTGDLAAARRIAAALRENELPALAGTLHWNGQAQTAGDLLGLQGGGMIQSLKIGSDPQAFSQDRITWQQDIELDQAQKQIHLKQFQLESGLLAATLTGTVRDYPASRQTDLAGHYDLSWEQLTGLLHAWAPSSRQQVLVRGRSRSDFRFQGNLDELTAAALLRQGQGTLPIGWDSAELMGLPLGAATIQAKLGDGQLTWPAVAIGAQGGSIHLRGRVELQQDEPVLVMSETWNVIENLPLNRPAGRMILAQINPIFVGAAEMSGKASLTLRQVAIPLSGRWRTHGRALGTLSLQDVQLEPKDFFGTLLNLLTLNPTQPQKLNLTDAKLRWENGRIHYDEFALLLAGVYDLQFSGSVGLDRDVALTVSLPVVPNLLSRFGVKGPVEDYARLLTGSRINIPIRGTLDRPLMELTQTNLADLLGGISDRLIRQSAENILDSILSGRPSDKTPPDSPGPSAPAPQTSPPATPPLQEIFDSLWKDLGPKKPPQEPSPAGTPKKGS
ncbi:MAG: hypothetical protein JW810_08325 [Sedimentisphaerales bacterium]|nr:hypothetical protein [Sedimentisphaerales bacterium]